MLPGGNQAEVAFSLFFNLGCVSVSGTPHLVVMHIKKNVSEFLIFIYSMVQVSDPESMTAADLAFSKKRSTVVAPILFS